MTSATMVTGGLEDGTGLPSSIKKGSTAGAGFVRPQEAPVFYPTAEEFDDPLAYLNKIRPIAEKAGICRICPPKDWQPPFAVDVDNFRFTPRIQRLNELEAKTRIKLNFLDQIAKFWELQGSSLKIPRIEKKALDLYSLHKLVQNEGGFEKLNTDKKWNRVSSRIGYAAGKSYGSLLRTHYEKILYPFDVFQKSKNNFKVVEEHEVPGREESRAHSSKNSKNLVGKSGSSTVSIDHKGMSKSRKGGATSGELRRLLFYGAGPKMESHNRQMEHLSEAFGGTLPPLQNYQDPLAKYVCRICRKGDGDDWMLLCDGCDDSYHTYCLSPPLEEVPKGEWRCPHCVAEEVCKPSEAFGFEQAQREYTLQQFGEMADTFKSEYFNMPVHKISTEVVEKEFWRIVSSIDEDVTVEYGADLHTMDHGSGFPTEKSNSFVPEDEKYIHSKWNLNNIPILPNSVLGHINADISGMKVPWMYVGMCFATFCWHNEDHWSYSINYLHWGEPKTWYGVPGSEADVFEEAMKSAAPELFQSQPDLLHQLVTIMNPNILMDMDVPVFRTDQKAGEFVITFPRAYHAGFNQGYNFAEAVNFAPADWLAMGRDCVSHYSSLHRYCVFSHDELVCKMGAEPQNLDLVIAVATYRDLVSMFETEKALRAEVLEWGTKDAVRASFEVLPDDERICDFCKTTCYLSAITCSCTDKLVCLRHFQHLCACPPSSHVMKFRYTLDELPGLLTNLQSRIKSYETWLTEVTALVDGNARSESKSLNSLQALVEEAEVRNYPRSSLWQTANDVLDDARKISKIAKSVLVGQIRTRNRENKIKFALTDIESLLEKAEMLPVDLDETPKLKELMGNIRDFQLESTRLLNMNKPCIDEIRSCLSQGQTFEVELPEVKDLEMALSRCKWLDTVEAADDMRGLWTLEYLDKVIESGLQLHKDPLTHERIMKLQKMRLKLLDWEERAKMFLTRSSPNLTIADLDALLKDGRNMDIALPSLPSIRDLSTKVHTWVNEVKAFENRKEFPFLETLETIVASADSLPVFLKQQKILSNQVQNARTWISKCGKAFLKKKSNWSLIEVMLPLTVYSKDKKPCGNTILPAKETSVKLSKLLGINQSGLQNSKVLHEAFNRARAQEKQLVESLRAKNRNVSKQENTFKCICNVDSKDFGIRCEICFDWFHATCVPLPKIFDLGDEDGITSLAMVCEQISAGVIQYICPVCCRSRRPKLETIVDLLETLHELPVKLYEGEILTLLVNRAMKWMDDARMLMSQEDMLKCYDELHARQHSSDETEGSKFLELSSTTVEILENLLIEGGLMEITFEETAKLWKVYSAYNHEFYAKKDLKLIRSQILNAVAGKRNYNTVRKSIARSPAGSHLTSGIPEKRKNVVTVNPSPKKSRVQEYDEDCAAIECRQPAGKEVNWVQCESDCLKWFHLICVGLKKSEVKKLKSYQCDKCSKA